MTQENTNSAKQAKKITAWVIFLTLLYAVVRYNIARKVSFEHLPLLMANKAFALSATILIGLSFLLGPLARFWPNTFTRHLGERKYLGIIGFAVAAVHAIVSLVVFNAANYAKFFLKDGRLNLMGETTMLFGILAFVIFSAISITSLPGVEQALQPEQWKRIQRYGYLAYFFVLLHVAYMGWSGWWQASSWQYGLASISLIASLFIVFVFIMRALAATSPRKDSGGKQAT